MNRRFWIYTICMFVSLAPLGWQTVHTWQVSQESRVARSVSPAPAPTAGGLELAGPALASAVRSGLLAADEDPKASIVSVPAEESSTWQPAWQAWARSRRAFVELKSCQRAPSLTAGIRILDDCRQRLEQAAGNEELLLALVHSELTLWKAVEASGTLATAAQEALVAKDYRHCLELCRDHSVKVAPFLNGPEAARFAERAQQVGALAREALLDVDYESIPAGSPEQKIAALDRFLALYGKDSLPQGAGVIKQASLELETLHDSEAVRQFVTAPPQAFAQRMQSAAELYNRFPEPQPRGALRAAAQGWLADFLADRPIPNCPGILETVSRTNGHLVLGCYEPQSGADGVYSYWTDSAQKSVPPIRVELARLDGPPRMPWFVTAAQAFNEQAAKVRRDPTSPTAWSDFAACCRQLEQQSAGYRARATQAGNVRPAEDASYYAGLTFQLEAEQSQIVADHMENLRLLFDQPPVLQEARR
ncbi:MAG TPA: hypothetical protein VHY20_08620 [Pirellulales bacterium]|nr:hypothetical protein [Pirellulales bacterium]